MPSRFAWMTRRSWKVRPAESLRIFCSVCLSGASRASTIRLRTPSCSMNAITSCCAPAPIDSIATTAATPKIMPSIVSSERSLWARRLSSPSRSSGRKSRSGRRWDTRAAHRVGCGAGRAGRRRLAACRAQASGSTSAISSPSFRPSSTARLSVRCVTLTSRRSKRSPILQEDVVLAVLLEHRLPRHVKRAGQLACLRSITRSRHTGLERAGPACRTRSVMSKMRRVALGRRSSARLARPRQRADFRGERLAGQRVD